MRPETFQRLFNFGAVLCGAAGVILLFGAFADSEVYREAMWWIATHLTGWQITAIASGIYIVFVIALAMFVYRRAPILEDQEDDQ